MMKDYKWRIFWSFGLLLITIFNYEIAVVSIHTYIFLLSLIVGWFLGSGLDSRNKKIKESQEEINRLYKDLIANKEQLNKFELVLNSLQEGILYLNNNWEFLYVNKTWEQMTGFTFKETVGKSIYEFIEPEYHCTLKEKLDMVTNNEGFRNVLLKINKKDDKGVVWVRFVASSLNRGCIATVADKTKLVELEENYTITHTRLQQILFNFSEGILLVDENNKVVLTNNQLQNYINNMEPDQQIRSHFDCVGMDLEDFLGKYVPYLLDDPEHQVEEALKLVRKKRLVSNEIIKLKNNSVLSFDFLPITLNRQYLGSLWSCRDITEQYYMHQALLQAKEEAENANKTKSTFLSNMSHEFRTPLNAIIGFSKVLKMQQDNFSDDQKDYLNEIINASDHLLRLVNDILNLSQIESGKAQLTLEKFPINDVLNESIRLVTPILQKQNLQLHTDLATSNNVYVNLDKLRLKQIFVNLLSNAIKYNKANGFVYISSTLDKKHDIVLVHIIDTGVGMKEEEIGNIFEEFYRGSEHEQLVEGTGVGLAITKKLVEHMDGSIQVQSIKDKGTKFTVTFPVIKEYFAENNVSEEPRFLYNNQIFIQ